jgi:protein TonB
MLAYAANRPVPVDRRPHPNTMLMIIGAHVAVAAVVMSAKIDLPQHREFTRTIVQLIPLPHEPPPKPIRTASPVPRNSWIDNPRPQMPTSIDLPPIDLGPSKIDSGPVAGAGATVITEIPKPITIARSGPQLLTPPSELKPPYPPSKLLNEEEAVLKLRLTIDANGRVTAVDPIGRADAAFLEAARRHLMAHWRYRPASEDGRAITSMMTVTLSFQLEG